MVLAPAPTNDTPGELSRLNRALQMLTLCNRVLIRATREADLLREVCGLIVEVGGYLCAWIGYASDDAERRVIPVAEEGVEPEFLQALNLSWAEARGGRGPIGRAIRERTIQITHDVRGDPVMKPYLGLAPLSDCASIIALPLIIDDRCIGALDIYSSRPNAFDAAETALLNELANDVAYGIRSLRLQVENQGSQRNLRLFRTLLDRANDAIYVIDATTSKLLDANDALSRWLGYTRAELLEMSVRDFSLTAEERPWSESVALIRESGTAAFEGQYRTRSGEVLPVDIGLTYVVQDGLSYIIVVSREASERRRQDEQIKRLTRALRMQSAIGLAALRINERDELLQEACRIAIELGGYDVAAVSIVDPDARYARPTFRAGRPRRSASPPVFSISDGTTPDTSLTGLALRTGKLTVCDDIIRSELPVAAREALYRDGVRSMVALPLIVDGIRVGVLTMTSPNEGQFVTEELVLLNDIMTTLSFALRSQQRADAVKYLAYFDPRSGLARRSLFCQRLESRLAHDREKMSGHVLVAFSVDRLGSVHERFGSSVTNELLKEVAERLRRYAEDDDLIGCLGPAEFVLVEPRDAALDGSRVALLESDVFAKPFSIEGQMMHLEGVATVVPLKDEGGDADSLVEKAAIALSRTREARALQRPDLFPTVIETPENLAVERKVRRATEERQFELYYLPQIDFMNAHVTAVEALLRWHDPDRGLLSPTVFLPVLECTGLVHAVGEWVFKHAVDDGMRWQTLGLAPVRVSVNVSAQQIYRPSFLDQCLEYLERWSARTAACGIDLEVSEAAILQDIDRACETLQKFRSARVRIVLNDFGAGDASLGLLSKVPLDGLKIDRSVIRGLPEDSQSMALATASIEAAKSFGIGVVAVGVEKPSQLDLLRRLGCGAWQGYLHGRPAPARTLERLLTSLR